MLTRGDFRIETNAAADRDRPLYVASFRVLLVHAAGKEDVVATSAVHGPVVVGDHYPDTQSAHAAAHEAAEKWILKQLIDSAG